MLQASPGNFTELEDILFTNNEMSNSVGVIGVKLATDSGQKVHSYTLLTVLWMGWTYKIVCCPSSDP